VYIINESGLYSLILSSKLPSVKRFKRWITSEVLPALRKTGSYIVPEYDDAAPSGLTTQDYLSAARSIAMSRKDQMPVVIDLLIKAGFDIMALPEVTSPRPDVYTEEEKEAYADEAWNALNRLRQKGLTFAQMGIVLQMHKGAAERYYNKRVRPRPNQARKIINAVNTYLDS